MKTAIVIECKSVQKIGRFHDNNVADKNTPILGIFEKLK